MFPIKTHALAGRFELSSISTLGFRGEALSSIASVAGSVEVHTKPRSALSGSYLKIVDDKVSGIKDIAFYEAEWLFKNGCEIEVKFYSPLTKQGRSA